MSFSLSDSRTDWTWFQEKFLRTLFLFWFVEQWWPTKDLRSDLLDLILCKELLTTVTSKTCLQIRISALRTTRFIIWRFLRTYFTAIQNKLLGLYLIKYLICRKQSHNFLVQLTWQNNIHMKYTLTWNCEFFKTLWSIPDKQSFKILNKRPDHLLLGKA